MEATNPNTQLKWASLARVVSSNQRLHSITNPWLNSSLLSSQTWNPVAGFRRAPDAIPQAHNDSSPFLAIQPFGTAVLMLMA